MKKGDLVIISGSITSMAGQKYICNGQFGIILESCGPINRILIDNRVWGLPKDMAILKSIDQKSDK
jgi:hypothetical protein